MSVVDDAPYRAATFAQRGGSSFAALYTDPGVLATERARLFARSWSVVSSADELAANGSYVTAAPGGIPVAVVRGNDGVLRAFHNVCRHRGITLLEGAGTVGRLMTCPYHQWSYDTTGALIRVPQRQDQFAELDPCTLGLLPARVAEWNAMVFVNPDPHAAELRSAMAGLDDRLDGVAAAAPRQVAVMHYEAACNWKLLVENHIDVYHLWYLHARSLAGYDHRQFHWESLGDNWWSLEPLKAPPFEHRCDRLAEETRQHIGAYLLFPNLMLVSTDA
jgi:phenylpropionate dioxygenase-like ring-hydroxylating dioxygenase large terminal subunit